MLLRTITLSNSGNVCLDGGGYILALGYECTRGIYQLQLRPTGEWEGLTIRACWHLPDGTSTTTLAVDGYVDVPAAVTALPGTGCITFEGAAEGKTITSSDLRYLVGDNSGVEDGSLPEPNTPAWEQLVGTVAESAAQAEAAADRADKAAAAAEGALTAVEGTASKALSDINAGKNTALEVITHRKEDALSAVSQAQTDATGAVHTAQQEAVDDITHTGTAQIQAVTQAGEQAVQEVDAAAQAGVGSVEQTGGTQVQAVANAGAEQVQAVEAAAAEKLAGITQLAGQAADSATKAEQAAQRAEDAAMAASTLIDDTAIADSKTWSSKGIVDFLCPPIQATGNPVVCHPVENYPLGVTVDFAPIQEGEGDPSPENVRPIKARKSVDVVRCGVNLCPYGTQTFVGYYGKSFGYFLPAGTYTFSAIAKSDDQEYATCLIYFFDTKESKGVQSATIKRDVNSSVTVSVPKKFDAIYLYSSIGASQSSGKSATFSDIQLEIGATAPTTYAPYTGQTATLTLPAPCYGGELDAVTGEGQETWHTIVLTGQESSHVFEKFFYLNIGNNPKPKDFTSGRSSHYKYATYGKGYIGVTKDGVSAVLGAEGQFAIDEAGLSAWKSYLAAQYAAGTPVQITYKLEKPTPITATGGKPIPALAGTNTLLTDGDRLTVTGRADPTHEIQQLRAAVVALGGTI